LNKNLWISLKCKTTLLYEWIKTQRYNDKIECSLITCDIIIRKIIYFSIINQLILNRKRGIPATIDGLEGDSVKNHDHEFILFLICRRT
jgi:hypothetical protein